MNGLDLLKEDHRRVEKLLEQIGGTSEADVTKRQDLYRQLADDMQAHEIIEEEILYPALKDHPKAREVVLEGYEEHHVIDLILDEMFEVPEDTEQWHAKLKVLHENLEHHIEEEEEEMFARARKAMSAETLDELGRKMAQSKAAATA